MILFGNKPYCILALKDKEEASFELPTTVQNGKNGMSTSKNLHKPSKKHHHNTSNLKQKRFKQSNSESAPTTSCQKLDDTLSDSNNSDSEHPVEDEHHICANKSSSDQAPTFHGHPVSNTKKSNNQPCAAASLEIQQLLSFTKKLESQYLKPMLVRQERLEEMSHNLFSNQMKIRNVLRKQKVIDHFFGDSYLQLLL